MKKDGYAFFIAVTALFFITGVIVHQMIEMLEFGRECRKDNGVVIATFPYGRVCIKSNSVVNI